MLNDNYNRQSEDMEREKHQKYSDKSQLNAFLLSLCLGLFGAGRLYVGDYFVGGAKILMALLTICLYISAANIIYYSSMVFGIEETPLTKLEEIATYFSEPYTYCLSIPIIAWYITDLIMFGCNLVRDEHELQLKPWNT